MKQSVRIILCILSGLLVAAAPMLVSSPAMLDEVKNTLVEQQSDVDLDEEEEEDGETIEIQIGRLLFGGALAEETEEIIEEEFLDEEEPAPEEALNDEASEGGTALSLPVDFSAGCAPNPAAYTETGYKDDSIEVTTEEVEEDGVIWHVCRVKIASPTRELTNT